MKSLAAFLCMAGFGGIAAGLIYLNSNGYEAFDANYWYVIFNSIIQDPRASVHAILEAAQKASEGGLLSFERAILLVLMGTTFAATGALIVASMIMLDAARKFGTYALNKARKPKKKEKFEDEGLIVEEAEKRGADHVGRGARNAGIMEITGLVRDSSRIATTSKRALKAAKFIADGILAGVIFALGMLPTLAVGVFEKVKKIFGFAFRSGSGGEKNNAILESEVISKESDEEEKIKNANLDVIAWRDRFIPLRGKPEEERRLAFVEAKRIVGMYDDRILEKAMEISGEPIVFRDAMDRIAEFAYGGRGEDEGDAEESLITMAIADATLSAADEEEFQNEMGSDDEEEIDLEDEDLDPLKVLEKVEAEEREEATEASDVGELEEESIEDPDICPEGDVGETEGEKVEEEGKEDEPSLFREEVMNVEDDEGEDEGDGGDAEGKSSMAGEEVSRKRSDNPEETELHESMKSVDGQVEKSDEDADGQAKNMEGTGSEFESEKSKVVNSTSVHYGYLAKVRPGVRDWEENADILAKIQIAFDKAATDMRMRPLYSPLVGVQKRDLEDRDPKIIEIDGIAHIFARFMEGKTLRKRIMISAIRFEEMNIDQVRLENGIEVVDQNGEVHILASEDFIQGCSGMTERFVLFLRNGENEVSVREKEYGGLIMELIVGNVDESFLRSWTTKVLSN